MPCRLPRAPLSVPGRAGCVQWRFQTIRRRPHPVQPRPRIWSCRIILRARKRAALSSPDGAHLNRRHHQRAYRPQPIRTGRRQRQRRQGYRPCQQACGHRDRDTQRVSIILNNATTSKKATWSRPDPTRRLALLHRRHRVRPSSNAKMVAHEMVYTERVEQFMRDQPGGGDHLVCRRETAKHRRHESRHAGRDHGHPRHRGAGSRSTSTCLRRRPHRNSRFWSNRTATRATTFCSTRLRFAPIATVDQAAW